MILMSLVSRHVDAQKRALLQYLADNEAYDAARAIDLSDVAVKPAILRSMLSRKVVRQAASGRYFVDPSRVGQAFGASNAFILWAMAAFLAVFFVIMLW
jgi:hypothetical protein